MGVVGRFGTSAPRCRWGEQLSGMGGGNDERTRRLHRNNNWSKPGLAYLCVYIHNAWFLGKASHTHAWLIVPLQIPHAHRRRDDDNDNDNSDGGGGGGDEDPHQVGEIADSDQIVLATVVGLLGKMHVAIHVHGSPAFELLLVECLPQICCSVCLTDLYAYANYGEGRTL